MILSDRDLRAALACDDLQVFPPPPDHAIQPASIDLHLGDGFRTVTGVQHQAGAWKLWPGDFILGHTLEHVAVGGSLVAQVDGKSSLGRRGVAVHITAGYIDPGFRGQVTLELHNCGPDPVLLTAGQPICQLVVMRLSSPALRSYGHPDLQSKYQDQTGATPTTV